MLLEQNTVGPGVVRQSIVFWIVQRYDSLYTAMTVPQTIHTEATARRQRVQIGHKKQARALLITFYIDHCLAGYCRHGTAPSGKCWISARRCEQFCHSNWTGRAESREGRTRSFELLHTSSFTWRQPATATARETYQSLRDVPLPLACVGHSLACSIQPLLYVQTLTL
jgi:hypothetical protein